MFFLGKPHVGLMKEKRLWLMEKKKINLTINEIYKN